MKGGNIRNHEETSRALDECRLADQPGEEEADNSAQSGDEEGRISSPCSHCRQIIGIVSIEAKRLQSNDHLEEDVIMIIATGRTTVMIGVMGGMTSSSWPVVNLSLPCA